MKIKWLLSVFLFVSLQAFAQSAPILNVHKQIIKPDLYYTIKFNYPLIANLNLANAQSFNQTIKNTINNMVDDFLKNVSTADSLKKDAKQMGIPLNVESNILDINYKIFYNQNNIISVRFDAYLNFYGTAHPSAAYQAVNFDLQQGKILGLSELFKPDNNYLQKISEFSQQQLTKKLITSQPKDSAAPKDILEQGTAATDDNFKVWNIKDKGILITFPDDQAAPRVFGMQEVLVPYTVLQGIISDTSPLKPLIQ